MKAVALKPGEKPPQFVVFSWDGALQGDDKLFSHYREMAKEYNAHMTFFLTGIYLLPKSKRDLYHPPMHPVGSAAIDFPTDQHIRDTLEQLRLAYEQGNDIGTHFNGHFCEAKGGGDWSVAQWKSARSTSSSPSSRTGRPTPATPTSRRCPSTSRRRSSAAVPPASRDSPTS